KDMPQEYEVVLRVVFLMGEMDGISFAAVPSRPTPVPEEPPPPQAAAAPPKPPPGIGSGPRPAAPGAGPVSGSGPKPGVGARPPGRAPTSPRPAVVQSPVKVTPATPMGVPAAESIEDL